jgi:flavin-dependent dehydrogenase
MQEIRLAGAEKAGAALKRGASVQGISETDGKWTVTFVEDGQPRSATARLVVRADGRSSRLREWGGFTVQRDPEDLRIAGAMVHNTMVPDDGVLIALLRV